MRRILVPVVTALFATSASAYWVRPLSGPDRDRCHVIDTETGLYWSSTVADIVTHAQAVATCSEHGMRLPTIGEIETAIDHGIARANHLHECFGTAQWFFWSATPGYAMSLENPLVNPWSTNYSKFKCVHDEPTPLPDDPILQPPVEVPEGPSLELSQDESIARHATAIVEKLPRGATGVCFSELQSRDFVTDGNGYYYFRAFVQSQPTGGGGQVHTFRVNVNAAPAVEAARLLLADPDWIGTCPRKSDAYIKEQQIEMFNRAVNFSYEMVDAMHHAVTSDEFDRYDGKLAPPKIIVTGDEVIVATQASIDQQMQLADEARSPMHIPQTSMTGNLITEEETLGDPNVVGIALRARAQRPANNWSSLAGLSLVGQLLRQERTLFDAEIRTSRVLQGDFFRLKVNGHVRVLGNDVREIEGIGPPAGVDGPGYEFFRNREFWRADTVLASPLGPVHVWGRALGSMGYKPWSAKMNADNRLRAEVTPYARIDVEAWGGLNYVVARGGVGGRVTLIDGALQLVAGQLEPFLPTGCVAVYLDHLKLAAGTLYLDAHAVDLYAGPVPPGTAQFAGDLCRRLEDKGVVPVDFVAATTQGVVTLRDTLGNVITDTGSFIEDGVTNVAETGEAAGGILNQGKEGLKDLPNKIKAPSPPKSMKVPSIYGAHGLWRPDRIEVPSGTCEIVDTLAQLRPTRFYHEFYSWDGLVAAEREQWFQRCFSPE